MSDKDYFLSKFGTQNHLDKLVNHENVRVRLAVTENPNTTKEHFDKLFKDESLYVRSSVSQNTPHKEHLDKLIKDKMPSVRYEITKNPKAGKEHLEELSKDENLVIRDSAKEQLAKRFPK